MPFPVELLRFFDRAAGGDQTPREGNAPRAPLAERLAQAEKELAEAAEPTSIASADDVPPVAGMEPEKPGIEPPTQDGAHRPWGSQGQGG
jgi:hypothetical protein